MSGLNTIQRAISGVKTAVDSLNLKKINSTLEKGIQKRAKEAEKAAKELERAAKAFEKAHSPAKIIADMKALRRASADYLQSHKVNTLQGLLTPGKMLDTGGFQNFGIRDLNKELSNTEKSMKAAAKESKQLERAAKGFKGELLSLMFFGMALQRVFGGFLMSAFQTFNAVTEGTQASNNSVNRLGAAWEFFKFSLIEALTSSALFTFFIEAIIALVDWFSGLSQSTQAWIGWAIVAIAALGGLFTFFGIVGLGITGMRDSLALAGESLKAFRGLFPKTAEIIGTQMGKILGFLDDLFVKMIANVGLTLLWVGSILVFAAVMLALKNKFGGWMNAIKAMVATVIMGIGFLVNLIVKGIEVTINAVLLGLSTLLAILSAAAQAVGLDWISEQLAKGSELLSTITEINNTDFMPGLAELVDKAGLNPTPVNQETNLLQSLFDEVGITSSKPLNVNVVNTDDIKQTTTVNNNSTTDARVQAMLKDNAAGDYLARTGLSQYRAKTGGY